METLVLVADAACAGTTLRAAASASAALMTKYLDDVT
jgi:hypothetical protein